MQHLEDTKNVAGLLWEHWLGEGQKALIIASLKTGKKDEKTAKQLAQFLAAVHDIGKATPVFQSKKGYANSKDFNMELLEKLERAGFEGISSITLANPEKSPHALAGQYILHYNKVKEDIATIVGGHHGKPVDDRATYKNQQSAGVQLLSVRKIWKYHLSKMGASARRDFKLGIRKLPRF